jgi:hypothetical protein
MSSTIWSARQTLAAGRASTRIGRISIKTSIVTFLSESRLPDTVSASSWSSTATDDVWQAHGSITKGLRSNPEDILSDSQGLESVGANRRVDREGFMDTAAPIRQGGVVKGCKSWRRGDDVDLVVTIKVSPDFKVSEV